MKIFFLSSWFPFPPDNGSRIRVYNLLRTLAQRHVVTLITFAESNEPTNTRVLETFCRVG